MSGFVIGFTGTRLGMTPAQAKAVSVILWTSDSNMLHHGDCVGADAEAHDIVKQRAWRVGIHPPTDEKLRAFCTYSTLDEMFPAKPYLERNADIVAAADLVVAALYTRGGMKGGTYWTINHAIEVGKPVVIVHSSGRVVERMP